MTGQTLAIILSQSAALLCLGAYLREYRLRLRYMALLADERALSAGERYFAIQYRQLRKRHTALADELERLRARLRKWTHRPRGAKGHYLKAPTL